MTTRESGGYATHDALGNLKTVSTVLSPASVATVTAAEQAVAVPDVVASPQDNLVFVNKPTSQAGLTLGMGRVSATANDLVYIQFANQATTSTVPTASETYRFGLSNNRGL